MPPADWTDLSVNYIDWRITSVDSSGLASRRTCTVQMTAKRNARGAAMEQFLLEFGGVCHGINSETYLPAPGPLTSLRVFTPNLATVDARCSQSAAGFLFDYGGARTVELIAASLQIS